ncbi:FadD3 family acyl-CoA ligase [Amycolatopsis minnesotensis]|uniref:FadD3 family acyl-CoA ligase n=1 Tax=Amycolatopsis minnesotensis TaxID=337894 RepID=A0ABP5BFZ2_9PSEU
MTEQTTPGALAAAARRFGAREALVDGTVRLTYEQLLDQVRRCAGFFAARGVRPGDRVAVNAPNTWHWVVAALGAHYAGAALVPVNTRFTAAETADILTRSGAVALVVTGEFLGTDRLAALQGTGTVPGVVLRIPVEGEEPPREGVTEWSALDGFDAAPAPLVSPDDVSDILFTSGTTGRSKGAMSSHRQALGVAAAWADHVALTPEDRYLVVNPFFHSFGYKAGILAALLRGAALVPQATFDVAAALWIIERERITVLPGAPTVHQSLVDHPRRSEHDLSSLRVAITGAATVPVSLVERLGGELGFGTVLTAYGLTEAVVVTMCDAGDDPHTVATTSGRPTAGFEVEIADSGEILVRGPNVMLGYLDDPEATAAAIDTEGWLHTGDVGALDERGYLRITDRIKDLYICGGFNVYPAEVEQVISRLGGVSEVAVVGMPDQRLGEVGLAHVVPSPGHELDEDTVLGHCRELLANYKVPRRVRFVTELPRNASGKVLKRVLRERTDG